MLPTKALDGISQALSTSAMLRVQEGRVTAPRVCVWTGHMESSEGCAALLEPLVARLQDHHAATLSLMMRHVCQLCRIQQARGHRHPPTQLLRTLSFALIRPPFEQIT